MRPAVPGSFSLDTNAPLPDCQNPTNWANLFKAGGWRSGSAAPLHGDGRGFESLIAHQPSLSASLRATDGRPALRSEHSGERRLPRRSKTKTGYDTQLLINAPNYGSASHSF